MDNIDRKIQQLQSDIFRIKIIINSMFVGTVEYYDMLDNSRKFKKEIYKLEKIKERKLKIKKITNG